MKRYQFFIIIYTILTIAFSGCDQINQLIQSIENNPSNTEVNHEAIAIGISQIIKDSLNLSYQDIFDGWNEEAVTTDTPFSSSRTDDSSGVSESVSGT